MSHYKLHSLGVMIDMSRNSVMSVDGLKRFLPLLKKMGYNTVMLYTEDTYEVEGEPYFGYLRGRYTMEEMKEIDTFATSLGIEIIPCIQTLAHLTTFLRWNRVPTDTPDILLVDDDKTYEFIDHLFATLSKCFKSKKIHLGMDEAHMLGRGKYLDIHGYGHASELMARHLNRVIELAKKYEYEPMIWSDMFFRSWNNGDYYIEKTKMPKEIVESFPSEIIPIHWDYYRTTEERYDNMLYNHKQLSKNIWFAGGVWSWSGMIPFNKKSIDRMVPAINACKQHKIRNIFFTMWGDNGGECSHFAQLPALLYLAEYAKGNTDEAAIKAKFRRIVGMDYDDFIKIDIPNEIVDVPSITNPSKYMLYADCFNGFFDSGVIEGTGARYAEMAQELYAVARKNRKYAYLFDCAAKLCEVLEYKYELSVKTRKAYTTGDRVGLQLLVDEDYKEVIKRLYAYHAAFQKQWFYDNKPHGFDVQDLRIGGTIQRIESCRKRIMDYTNRKIDSIPELEEKLIEHFDSAAEVNDYQKTVTVNVM